MESKIRSCDFAWESVPLSDLVDPTRGISYGIVQPGKPTIDGVPIIRVNDISDGQIRPANILRVDGQIESKYGRTRLRASEVLLTVVGAYFGKTAIVTPAYHGWNVARAISVIPLLPHIDPKWVTLCLETQQLQQCMQTWATTTAQPTLNLRDVANLPVPMPEERIRNRIVDIVGTLDDKIELNRRMNETLESMARRLFKSWFVDFDPVHAKARLRREHPKLSNAELSRRALPNLIPEIAELFPDKFEDSTLGPIPKGWQAGTVADAIEINPTRSIRQSTIVKWLDMSNMPTNSARATTWEEREFKSGTKFENLDTLVARITPCLENGKTAFVDFLEPGETAAGSTEYIVLRPKTPLPAVFAYFLARTEEFRQHLIANMTGTSGRQRVPANCIDTYPLVTPPEGVATQFGAIVGGMFAQMRSNDDESAQLSDARDKLLPRLLSGDLSVSQEVAS
jgi:type I restriction enzyme, S subunit